MPFSRGLGREIMYICVSGVLALYIFYITRPIGFSNLGDLTLIGYGLVSIAAGILYLSISHYLYNRYWGSRNWTLGLEILHSLLFLLFIAAAIMTYGNLVRATKLSFKSSVNYFLYTVLLGIVPVIIRAILIKNWRLKKNLQEVERINELLQNRKSAPGEKVIEFSISSKETFRVSTQSLLFLESKGNYINVWWNEGHDVKKHLVRMTLREAIKLIDDPLIVHSHRSFAVNLRKAKEINLQAGVSAIVLKGVETRVPLSSTYNKQIRQKLRDVVAG